ncbi:response regulator [Clostridium lacusfryxellense]|uniref:response regulator n=1 Tax=Clostridium lacusfryxellense TaxID=205328 RepID=UPI001C0B544A|nr:response regulator [Clostridium lacusfryxellense]MBU3113274.1 response regulator [Clostridium lacusfryxellense]
MLKLIIVDDEAVIRKGIITSIDWCSYDIEVVAEGINGRDGMDKVLINEPHILITDIRMPVMDGLELSRIVKEKLPTTKIIILSGYSDFPYAKEALKIGVNEYLLKPVGAEELISTVVKLRDQILQEQEKINLELSSYIFFNENLPYMQSRFSNELVNSEIPLNDSTYYEGNKFGISINGPEYQVLVIEIDNFVLLTENYLEKHKNLLKFGIINIISENLNLIATSAVVYGEGNSVLALININSDNKRNIKDVCIEIQFDIKKYMKVTVCIGMGGVYASLNNIPKSYVEAKKALKSKVFKGKNQVIIFDELGDDFKFISMTFPTQHSKQLLDCIKSMDYLNLNHIIDQIFIKFLETKLNYELIKNIIVKIIINALNLLEEIGVDFEKDLGKAFDPFIEIEKHETIEDIHVWVSGLFEHIIELVKKSKSESYRKIINIAMNYVNEHYSEDIKIQDITKGIYITPNYFSTVFKEEVGETFVDWLNSFRVEKAKALLKDIKLKTYEVAEKVGYNDYKYFSTVFKKYTGFTPKEFKEANNI